MAERALKSPTPATHYVPMAVLAQWFAEAADGETRTYARGPAIDHRQPAAVLAQRWGREGLVHPYQKRIDARTIEYRMRKLAALGAPALAGTAPAPQPQSLDPESVAGRIYALLRRCANLDQPCPSHEAIAERLALRDRAQAANRTRALIERGLIRIDWPARTGPRIVTIVATGKQTAASLDRRVSAAVQRAAVHPEPAEGLDTNGGLG